MREGERVEWWPGGKAAEGACLRGGRKARGSRGGDEERNVRREEVRVKEGMSDRHEGEGKERLGYLGKDELGHKHSTMRVFLLHGVCLVRHNSPRYITHL